jgi:bacillopeptidase F
MRPFSALFALVLLLAGCAASHRGGSSPSPRFEGDLESRLSAAPEDQRFTVLVDLRDGFDPVALRDRLRREGVPKAERRSRVVEALEREARTRQAPLIEAIDRAIAEGTLDYASPVAIVNRLVIEGSAAGILTIAKRPEVAIVRPDWTSRPAGSALEPSFTPDGSTLPDRFVSWAIPSMRADAMWERGLTGAGVVVASIDTGVYGAHEQLAGRNAPEPRGWFDPVEGSTEPRDPHGHGTGVLSVAVGGNVEGRMVGIAPGATWASALGNWRNYYSRSRMTLAADWILRTARPDVLINAWSHDEGRCTDFDLPFVRAWEAAEIFVAFPTGNAGPAPGSGESPAQLAGIFAVAGIGPAGGPSATSSRGPSPCGSTRFPTVAAPGAALPHAHPFTPRSYLAGQGTSFSVGLAGGGAALLLQARPEATPEEIARALEAGARDVAPPGIDDATGAGAIDLPAALAALERAR